jgi:hypothetical protein
MQRVTFALLLVCASSAALAKNVVTHEATATADSGSTDVQDVDNTSVVKPDPPKASTNRNVKSSASAQPVDMDNSDADPMPRAYFGKWHSFLPGMFR